MNWKQGEGREEAWREMKILFKLISTYLKKKKKYQKLILIYYDLKTQY